MYTLVDAPIGPYSSLEELRKWIEELESWPGKDEDEGIQSAIAEAKEYLSRNFIHKESANI